MPFHFLLILLFCIPFAGQAGLSSGIKPELHPGLEKGKTISIHGQVPPDTKKSSDAAEEIIHSIVSSVGLKPNFEIREAKISNAAAVTYRGKRFILYDASFIKRIQDAAQTDWAGVSILAHEIGHHLNGHTMSGKGEESLELELEADEFSGFILRQMGASLEDAQKAMKIMSSVNASASHPGRTARLAAIEKGYISANERILAYAEQPAVHIAASAPQQEEKEERRRSAAAFAMAEESIFKEVHFNLIPDLTFYLTKELKLIALTDEGPAVYGNLAKSNDKYVLKVYDKRAGSKSFYVSRKGTLVDERNRVVGYIKNPA